MLNFSLGYFEFKIFDAVLLENIGKFEGTINDVGKFINPQKLEILCKI